MHGKRLIKFDLLITTNKSEMVSRATAFSLLLASHGGIS